MSETLWIFIYNSYYPPSPVKPPLKSIKLLTEELPKIIKERCILSHHKFFFDLSEEELIKGLISLGRESYYSTIKNVIIFLGAHGEEYMENKAPAFIDINGKLIYLHVLMKKFFSIKKNVYMFVDICRVPTSVPVRLETSLSSNDGYFIMVSGTERDASSSGKLEKIIFKQINKICKENPLPRKMLNFTESVILDTMIEYPETHPKIYVNEKVRIKYDSQVKKIQELTTQDRHSIRATLVGKRDICGKLRAGIIKSKDDPLKSSTLIIEYFNMCPEEGDELKLFNETLINIKSIMQKISEKIHILTTTEEPFITSDHPHPDNKLFNFTYWRIIKKYFVLWLRCFKALNLAHFDTFRSREEIEKYKKNKRLITYLGELVSLEEKQEVAHAYCQFNIILGNYRLMLANERTTPAVKTALRKLIAHYEKIENLRNPVDFSVIFNKMRDMEYFSGLKSLLPNNKKINELAVEEKNYQPIRKLYVTSRSYDHLRNIKNYFKKLEKDFCLSEKEKRAAKELTEQYLKRLTDAGQAL